MFSSDTLMWVNEKNSELLVLAGERGMVGYAERKGRGGGLDGFFQVRERMMDGDGGELSRSSEKFGYVRCVKME